MKRVLPLLISAVMVFLLSACAGQITDNTADSNKTVDVVFTYFAFDNSVVNDEYIQRIKQSNPNYINVEKYDDTHYTVTMLESQRDSMVKTLDKEIENKLDEALSKNELKGVFTKIEVDNLLKEAHLYADKAKFDSLGLSANTAPIIVQMLADAVQAYNLIDISERSCSITIIDEKTGDVLYPVQ